MPISTPTSIRPTRTRRRRMHTQTSGLFDHWQPKDMTLLLPAPLAEAELGVPSASLCRCAISASASKRDSEVLPLIRNVSLISFVQRFTDLTQAKCVSLLWSVVAAALRITCSNQSTSRLVPSASPERRESLRILSLQLAIDWLANCFSLFTESQRNSRCPL